MLLKFQRHMNGFYNAIFVWKGGEFMGVDQYLFVVEMEYNNEKEYDG